MCCTAIFFQRIDQCSTPTGRHSGGTERYDQTHFWHINKWHNFKVMCYRHSINKNIISISSRLIVMYVLYIYTYSSSVCVFLSPIKGNMDDYLIEWFKYVTIVLHQIERLGDLRFISTGLNFWLWQIEGLLEIGYAYALFCFLIIYLVFGWTL